MIGVTYVDSAGFIGMYECDDPEYAAREIDMRVDSGDIKTVRNLYGAENDITRYVEWHKRAANARICQRNGCNRPDHIGHAPDYNKAEIYIDRSHGDPLLMN